MVGVAGLGALVAFFAVGTPLMALFDVQDNLLTGLRKAMVVPLENLLFSLLKVALLVLAVVIAIPGGIGLSWTAATGVAVIAISIWVFGRVLPTHAATTEQTDVTVRGIASRVWTTRARSSGTPRSTACRCSCWPGSARRTRQATTKRALILTVPAVAVPALGAHPILAVFGEHYTTTGTGALMLAALSALPNIVTASALAAARVQRRMRVLLGVPAAIAIIVIGMSWVVAPRWGLTGVGLSWLVGQTAVALALARARADRARQRSGGPRRRGRSPASRASSGRSGSGPAPDRSRVLSPAGASRACRSRARPSRSRRR